MRAAFDWAHAAGDADSALRFVVALFWYWVIRGRLGEGAKVELSELDAEGTLDIEDLLDHYVVELRATGQQEEAERIVALAATSPDNFLMIVPQKVQTDPNISTE